MAQKITLTKKQLATVAGYTYRRLYDINRDLPDDEKLFVETDDGKCDLAIFVQRWLKYNINNEVSTNFDLDAVKARHEIVKTRKTELEVARMEGTQVDVQDVKRLWGEIANTLMQTLIHIPSKVAPLLLMMDSVQVITNIIDGPLREALEQIAVAPIPEYAQMKDRERENPVEEDADEEV